MSDEAAFLAALTVNPADDTARLVYADWLDEHDDAMKAEYLRAMVEVTRSSGGSNEHVEAAARLFRATKGTATDWRYAAGGRFDVVLESYEPRFKLPAIKIVREQSDFGLNQAKALVESVPIPLFSWLPFEDAFAHLLAFGTYRGRIHPDPIRATLWPAPWSEDPPGRVFNVEIHTAEFARDNPSAIVRIGRLLSITPEEVATRLERLPLIVASDLPPAKLADFLRTFRTICCAERAIPFPSCRVVPHTPT